MRDGSGFVPLTVSAVETLTEDAVLVSFDLPDEHVSQFRFRAGQHLAIRRRFGGEEVRRTYSICAPADGAGPLRVAVKRLGGGRFSTWATTLLRAGEVLDVLPPAGSFGFDPERAPSHIVAVGAGSGITPLLSIVHTALVATPDTAVTLLYGNRTTADVMFLDELADLKDCFASRFTLLHVLSREMSDTDLLNGRIDGDKLRRLLEALIPPETVDDWYLCGPLAMVGELRRVLADAGVERHHVHAELFYAGEVAAPPPRGSDDGGAGTATVTVSLHGRSTTMTMAQGGDAILDRLLLVRSDAPYACKGGVCGTCRAQVRVGAVEMALNYALEDDEVADGMVLTCQSRPTTDQVDLVFGEGRERAAG